MKTFVRLVVSFSLACISQLGAQTSVHFNLGGPGETIQDHFVFASGGVTATATAWSMSRSATSPTFQPSEVVQWSPGIGVKNATESITTVPYVPFYVDNQDHYDFVLFVFSKKVDIASVQITPSAGTFDLDASFWFGNVDSGVSLTGSSLSGLTNLGFGSRLNNDSVASHSARTLGLTTPDGGVNALLFGSRVNGDAEHDRFKISAVHGTTLVPEPSSAGLVIASLAFALGRRRR